jgi:nitroreductase
MMGQGRVVVKRTVHDGACARRVLGLPDTQRVSIVLAFGYQAPDERRPTSPRLPLDELIHYERWQGPGGS